MSLDQVVVKIQSDPAIVGRPCRRYSCEHGFGLHDEEGCVICGCGYFLHADLMVEVDALSTFRRAGGYDNAERNLYGWLRVFEGMSDQQAQAVVGGRIARPAKNKADRKRKAVEALL